MLYQFRRRLYHLIPRWNVELMYVHHLNNTTVVQSKLDQRSFLLDQNNVHRISEVKKLPLKKMQNRLKQGDRCYVTEHEGKIISYQWVQYEGRHFIQQSGRWITVKDGECWIYHARVLEKFQGNRINKMIKSTILSDAKKEGLQKAWVYTNLKNTPNRRGLEKLGFELDHKIYSLKIDNKFYQLFKRSSK